MCVSFEAFERTCPMFVESFVESTASQTDGRTVMEDGANGTRVGAAGAVGSVGSEKVTTIVGRDYDDDDDDYDEEDDDVRCLKRRRRVDDDDSDDVVVRDVDGKEVLDRRFDAVKVGDRLEVQWEVSVADEDEDEDADKGEEEDASGRVKWWPCVVVREEDGTSEGTKTGKCFGLVYDAMDGFESERRRVVFSRAGGARQLEHAGEAGVFRWRREGDVDDAQDDDDDVETVVEEEDAPTTMREILEAQGEIDAENGGVSLESAAMGAFATLPMNQQMNMATAFAGFKEKLMAKLSGLAAEKGAEGVVTKDDIDGILSDIQKGA